MTSDYIRNVFLEIVETGNRYGFHTADFKDPPKRVIVEYSSPNIAKRFHAGHFRSTIVGQAVSNILEAAGNNVTRINYLGDWGMQFAILHVGYRKFNQNTPSISIKHLHEIYVRTSKALKTDEGLKQEARSVFSDMEKGEPTSLEFWKMCREASLKEFDDLYRSIGIRFDDYESESMYTQKSQELLDELKHKGMLYKLENETFGIDVSGSRWFDDTNFEENAKLITLMRSNSTSLYLTRDVTGAIERYKKYNFDKMFYVTDTAQECHFTQLFAILDKLGHTWASKDVGALRHISFGRVQGMKTREGDVVFFEDILQEAFEGAKTERLKHETRKNDLTDLDFTLRNLGLSGLICHDLKARLKNDYRFNWEAALRSKGYTGVYLQYTHSRLESLKQSCGFDLCFDIECSSLLDNKSSVTLIQHLCSYSKATSRAYAEIEPCYITQYAFKLSHMISRALGELTVKGQPKQIAQPRLCLFSCSQMVLRNCMLILGMKPLNKM